MTMTNRHKHTWCEKDMVRKVDALFDVCLELQDIIQDNMAELFDHLFRQIENGTFHRFLPEIQAGLQARKQQFVAMFNEHCDTIREYQQQHRELVLLQWNERTLLIGEKLKLRIDLGRERDKHIRAILSTLPQLVRTDSEDGGLEAEEQVLQYIIHGDADSWNGIGWY